jgi:hypothetical protein
VIAHPIEAEAALDAFVGEGIFIGAGSEGEIHPTALLEGGKGELEREIVQVDDHRAESGMECYVRKVNRPVVVGLE